MNAKKYEVPAAKKLLDLFEILCESHKSLTTSEVCEEMNISVATAFRLLQTLTSAGWVIKEDEGPRYKISLKPFHYASKPVARMKLKTEATVLLRQLRDQIGECCYLCIIDNDMLLMVDAYDPIKGAVQLSPKVGSKHDFYSTAPGKILLAYNSNEFFDKICKKGFLKKTSNTITKKKDLKNECQLIKENGFALDNEEESLGLLCLSVPIFDYNGNIIGAIGTSILTMYYTLEKLKKECLPLLINTGIQISKNMGYQGEMINE